jgi:hemolysin activation/secretion protein
MVGTLIISQDTETYQIKNGENLKVGNIIVKLNVKKNEKRIHAVVTYSNVGTTENGKTKIQRSVLNNNRP